MPGVKPRYIRLYNEGLLFRHLVLPENQAETYRVIDFVKSLSPNTYFNLMDQYHPAYHACDKPVINRRITREEFGDARNYAVRAGLKRLAE